MELPMVVSETSNLAYRRFVGPSALLDLARDAGMDRVGGPGLLAFLERARMLVPITRWREPLSIRVRRMSERSPHFGDSSLPHEPDGQRLDDYVSVAKSVDRWGHKHLGAPALHPFDDTLAQQFLESPEANPANETTYERAIVGQTPDGVPLKELDRIPLYRGWQALQLMEIAEARFGVLYPGSPSLISAALRTTSVLPGEYSAHIRTKADVDAFDTHRAALEAASWYEAYARRALNLADSTNHADGTYTIEGVALADLRREEEACATVALQRSGASRPTLIECLRWLAGRFSEETERGHVKVAAAYKHLAADVVDLMKTLGENFTAISVAVGPEEAPILDELWPDWLSDQIDHAMRTMQVQILPDLAQLNGAHVPPPSEARAKQFLDWLATQGLSQAFWHFEELLAIGRREDHAAIAGTAREVTGMSATVEHIANALGAPTGSLHPKLKHLWQSYPGVISALDGASKGHTRTTSTQDFKAHYTAISTYGTGADVELIARDLAITLLVRNHGLHQGLTFLNRRELIDVFITMFRAAFLTWHITTP